MSCLHDHFRLPGAALASALLFLASMVSAPADAATPSIKITSAPAYATVGSIQGVVSGVANFADYRVATYLSIDAVGWWTKPTSDSPTVAINADGTFSVPVVSGGLDDRATLYATALVPVGTTPPLALGAGSLPTVPNAVATDSMYRYSRNIAFGGYQWGVRESQVPLGPGSNTFSNRPQDVWVDGQGQLHLTISNHDGRWWGTQVMAQGQFGYGTYVLQTNSPVDRLDPAVTFGAFTWDPFGGGAASWPWREIDIEDGRWGNASDTASTQFVVQPWYPAGNLVRYSLPDLAADPALTRIFEWKPDGIHFIALKGHHMPGDYLPGDVIFDWTYQGADLPQPGREVANLNLWLNNAEATPLSGQAQEVIISDFVFLPVPVPEPATALSLAVGIAALSLAWVRHRRRSPGLLRSPTASGVHPLHP